MSSSAGGISNHDDNNDFSFEPNAVIVKSTAGGKKKKWSLHAHQLLKEDDTTFVHIKTKYSNVQRMLAAYLDVNPKKVHGIFQKTDVCQQLTKIKNLKIRQLLVKSNEDGEVTRARFRYRLKKYSENRLRLPRVITINTPSFGDIEGIAMKVISTAAGGKGHGLYVEMNSKNFEYIGRATKHQYDAGGVEKKKPKPRKRKANKVQAPLKDENEQSHVDICEPAESEAAVVADIGDMEEAAAPEAQLPEAEPLGASVAPTTLEECLAEAAPKVLTDGFDVAGDTKPTPAKQSKKVAGATPPKDINQTSLSRWFPQAASK